MEESLKVFQDVVTAKIFYHTPIILFLNKVDLFTEKIEISDLKSYFSNYNGAYRNPDQAKEFILKMFLSMIDDKLDSGSIYHHFTCATGNCLIITLNNSFLSISCNCFILISDTENISRVFKDVTDIIIEYNLKNFNLN